MPGSPGSASVQVPGVALQTSQAPSHAVLQQKLSEQEPFRHSLPALHACPSSDLHRPLTSQVLVLVQVSGSSSLCTSVQVPRFTAHVRQGWSHAV